MNYFILIFACLFTTYYHSQLLESFSDGNFTSNPIWTGNEDLFVIENGELRSNSPSANEYYLSTTSTFSNNVEWSFYFNLKFSTSGSNYVDFYLMADNSDLLLVQNGYFVRAGNTADEISLYSIVNGVETKIIDGVDNSVNSSSNNPFRIRVQRNINNLWTLETDDGNLGTYVVEGTVLDNSVLSSAAFGIKIIQSSASSVINKHFFDNFSIGIIGQDVLPPSLNQIVVNSSNQIDLIFSEDLDEISAEVIGNYSILPAINISSVQLDDVNKNIVHLTSINSFASGTTYALSTNLIADLNGNVSGMQNLTFEYTEIITVLERDIIINEFMCDPSPIVGLPDAEFVEIFNRSTKTIDLSLWKIGDNATFGTIQTGTIAPGEYKVLCSTSNTSLFTNAIGVTSFPSLNNSGDDIQIKTAEDKLIDKITYDISWYQDDAKSNGGYSIELKNPNTSCGGNTNNWAASNNSLGGTPGLENSILDLTPDTQTPTIISLETIQPNFVNVTFSEKMDSLSLTNSTIIVSNLTLFGRYIAESHPSSILLEFVENLASSTKYFITFQNVADCSQNFITLNGEFSLAEKPKKGDLVINEVLFDPITFGSDYVEIKNISNKILDVKGLKLANYNDSIANIKEVVFTKNLSSNELVVFTPDSAFQKKQYPYSVPGKFIQMSLPSYNNDSGTVYLLYENEIIDKLSYTSEWHYQLLDNFDGKSLERINPMGLTDDKNNWHSASSTVSFGTPGAENSQLMFGEQNGEVNLTNQTFSPDNDGFEDVLQINYTTEKAGFQANIKIYDDRGRWIHTIAESELISTNGSFIWNGVTEKNQKASIGIYVLIFEAFHLDGTQFAKKLSFVLAGK